MAGGMLDRDFVVLRRERFGASAVGLFRRIHSNVGAEDRGGLYTSRATGRSDSHDGRSRKPTKIFAQVRAGKICCTVRPYDDQNLKFF